jgi:prefoldin alpha subunit
MANEEELEKISDELQLQQAKGEAIRQQIQALQGSVVEISAAMEALQNIKKAKGDTLVPVGAGVFFSCPKPDQDRVVMNIGAGIMVNRKPEEALRILEERQKKLSDAMGTAQAELTTVVKAIESLTASAGALGAAEERNVRAAKG